MAGALRDSIDEMGRSAAPETVAALAIKMRRLRHAQLTEIAAALNTEAFRPHGYRSATDWLVDVTGESVGRCKTWIRWAERLRHMPHVDNAFKNGRLAESALELLVSAWHVDIADVFTRDEELLLRWATTLPHPDFRLVIDTWRQHADPDRANATASEQFERRSLHVSRLMDGMGQLDGILDPEGLSLVREAIRVFSSSKAEGDTRTPAQRRADGLVNVARTALAHAEHVPGEKRRRPKVIATSTINDLITGASGGRLDTEIDTTAITPAQIRQMCCDAQIHRYIADPQGTVIDYGQSRRTVSDAQFDQLVIRDHGCRWPGCGIPSGGCDAHHATHWLDHGPTANDNLILLCWHHHRLLHSQHWSITPHRGGHFTLTTPTGTTRGIRPPLVGIALPLDHAA